jgi:hypothetical protein
MNIEKTYSIKAEQTLKNALSFIQFKNFGLI